MAIKKTLVLFLLCACVLCALSPPLYADNLGLIARGVMKTFTSVFKLPAALAQDSMRCFPFGIVGGAFRGTYETVAGTLSGAFDIARGGAPYAKYMIFLI